METVELIF